jgi:hypothetical protein
VIINAVEKSAIHSPGTPVPVRKAHSFIVAATAAGTLAIERT